MKKKIASVAAATLLGLGLVAGYQEPAAASWSQCPPGLGCVWTDINGGGQVLGIAFSSIGVMHCVPFNPPFNNSISSAKNGYGSNVQMVLYSTPNCVNWPIAVEIDNGTQRNLTGLQGDAASSILLYYGN